MSRLIDNLHFLWLAITLFSHLSSCPHSDDYLPPTSQKALYTMMHKGGRMDWNVSRQNPINLKLNVRSWKVIQILWNHKLYFHIRFSQFKLNLMWQTPVDQGSCWANQWFQSIYKVIILQEPSQNILTCCHRRNGVKMRPLAHLAVPLIKADCQRQIIINELIFKIRFQVENIPAHTALCTYKNTFS